MPVGDLYMARVQQSLLGEQMENRFFYELVAGTGGFLDLHRALFFEVLPQMKAVQSDGLVHVQTVIVNLDDVTDFGTTTTGGTGTRVGEPLPPYAAWGFTLFSADRRLRSGGKRVAGPIEVDVASGVATGVAPALLATLALAFVDDIPDVSSTSIFSPRLHRAEVVSPPAPAITVTIRSVLYRRVTTQSSRKFPA